MGTRETLYRQAKDRKGSRYVLSDTESDEDEGDDTEIDDTDSDDTGTEIESPRKKPRYDTESSPYNSLGDEAGRNIKTTALWKALQDTGRELLETFDQEAREYSNVSTRTRNSLISKLSSKEGQLLAKHSHDMKAQREALSKAHRDELTEKEELHTKELDSWTKKVEILHAALTEARVKYGEREAAAQELTQTRGNREQETRETEKSSTRHVPGIGNEDFIATIHDLTENNKSLSGSVDKLEGK